MPSIHINAVTLSRMNKFTRYLIARTQEMTEKYSLDGDLNHLLPEHVAGIGA
jgi:hypothetical protein